MTRVEAERVLSNAGEVAAQAARKRVRPRLN
jgi:hypothetical protein